jgi:hypothetical protein
MSKSSSHCPEIDGAKGCFAEGPYVDGSRQHLQFATEAANGLCLFQRYETFFSNQSQMAAFIAPDLGEEGNGRDPI